MAGLPENAQAVTVSDLFAAPDKWDILTTSGREPRDYHRVPAKKFLKGGNHANIMRAPSGMVLLCVEREPAFTEKEWESFYEA